MTTVFYNETFHKLCPTTKKSTNHYLVDGGTTIPRNKSVCCNFWLNDIVYYREDYWKVIHIVSSKVPSSTPPSSTPYEPIIKRVNDIYTVHYHIRLLVDAKTLDCNFENNKTELVEQSLLTGLNKADTSDILALSHPVNRYNTMILKLSRLSTSLSSSERTWLYDSYLDLYPPKLVSLPYVCDIKKNCKLRGIKISELASIIKRNKGSHMQLRYISQDPFSFIQEDWELFSFDTACKIADHYHLSVSDAIKERAWIYSYVHDKKKFYIEKVKDRMEVDWEKNKYRIYKSAPRSMISSGILLEKNIDGKIYYTTQYLIDFEKKLGDKFIEYFSDSYISIGVSIHQIEEYITEFENELDKNGNRRFRLNPKQRKAVIKSIIRRLSIITGFPGSGKSTIVECILYILCKLNRFKNISICAPTGLAYKNLIDKTRKISIGDTTFTLDESSSGTMHKVIYNDCPRIHRIDKKKTKLDTIHTYKGAKEQQEAYDIMENIDIFIPDESSMIDTWMFNKLVENCIKFDSQLIMIGDMNQLPPVGPGKILKSIIDSGFFEKNIVKLDTICRQNNGALLSGICKMAAGRIITSSDFDSNTLQFHLSESFKTDERLDASKLYAHLDTYSLTATNSKVLCYNTGDTFPINTITINNMLQNKYNPEGIPIQKPSWGKFEFRVGDRIILTTNESQSDIYHKEHYRVNGDEAEITRIEKDIVYIKYFGSTEHFISINSLYLSYQLSYALSVHKSQGSQYDNVVFILDNIYNIDKPVIFTAISRAKERCFVISEMDKFTKAQKIVNEKPSLFMKEFLEYDILEDTP